jgi:Na+-driven multidrug efflux pump
MKQTDVNMLSGSTFKILLRISIPIMIMNVLQSLISIIDMTVLGIMVNDDAVGSVGACSTLITLITGLVIGISVGSNVIIARCIGKGDKEGAQRAVGTSVLLSLVGGVALLILGVFFATPLLRLMN